MPTKSQLKEGYEKHTYYSCQEPGCSSGGGRFSSTSKAMHQRATGHHNWKAHHEFREKEPMKVSYQPGYGPK